MTATVFADEMGVSYPTVVRWLKRGLVPNAELKEAPERGKWWEIPETSLQMERPPAGRKPGPKPKKAEEDQQVHAEVALMAKATTNRASAKKATKK